MTTEHYTVALAGNPNAGKSTIFNALTGAHQHVGNWPGKTVEMKAGQFSIDGTTLDLIDLPGTYSLTAYSIEEVVTRDFLVYEHPDAVIAVVDAANLERNLYLVVQFIELGVPVVVALNMTDIATARGLKIDLEILSAGLGVPILTTIATQGQGLKELKKCVLDTVRRRGHTRSVTQNEKKHAYNTSHCPKCG
jgi:ferrous iron transport protein B